MPERAGIIRSRPLYRTWAATFSIEHDSDILVSEQILAVLADAGRKVGLGEYRPGVWRPLRKVRGREMKTRR